MANHIGISILRPFMPGRYNRDFTGRPKQCVFGGVTRARVSKYAYTRSLRQEMEIEEIRTAHIELFVDFILDQYVQDGTITAKEKEIIGSNLCTPKVLCVNNKFWTTRPSFADYDLAEFEDEEEQFNEEDKTSKKDGRQIVCYSFLELKAAIDAAIEMYKVEPYGLPKPDGSKKIVASPKFAKEIEKAIKAQKPNESICLFGNFPNDGVVEHYASPSQISNMISVDELNLEADDWGAWASAHSMPDANDPFFNAVRNFSNIENGRKNYTNSGSNDIYANIMFNTIHNNIDETCMLYLKKGNISTENAKEWTSRRLADLVEKSAIAMPSGGQSGSASYVEPCILKVDVVEHGRPYVPDFSEVIRRRETSISEQAVRKILDTTENRYSLSKTKITSYVLNAKEYDNCVNEYASSDNIVIVRNLRDLRDIVETETRKILDKSITG